MTNFLHILRLLAKKTLTVFIGASAATGLVMSPATWFPRFKWSSSRVSGRGKTTRLDLKLGISSRFEPISSLEFEERKSQKFWAVLLYDPTI